MKALTFISFILMISSCAVQHESEPETTQIVEVSCGICQLGMEGSECELAIRIDGQCY